MFDVVLVMGMVVLISSFFIFKLIDKVVVYGFVVNFVV